jgi:hypothetical protein
MVRKGSVISLIDSKGEAMSPGESSEGFPGGLKNGFKI